MDFENWHLKDTIVSSRGAKSCHLRTADHGAKVSFYIGSTDVPVSTPFGATSFQQEESSRKTLELTLTPEMEKMWTSFDDWAVDYIVKHSFRLFKSIKTEEEVRANYRSPVTKKGDYRAHIRCKINTDGSHIVRCWDMEKKKTKLPYDPRDAAFGAKIQISHMWMLSKEFGCVIQITEL